MSESFGPPYDKGLRGLRTYPPSNLAELISAGIGAEIRKASGAGPSLDKGSLATEIRVNLASSGIDTAGQLVTTSGYGLVYRRDNSNPAGRLDLELGGMLHSFYPGARIKGRFDGFRVVRASSSAVVGLANLLVLTQEGADFLEPSGDIPGVGLSPVDLLGVSTTPTFVAQGEATIPPVQTLNYDALTTAFTLGAQVSGGTSLASGIIVTDNGGTLELASVAGVFQNNEALSDSAGGAATCDGVLAAIASGGCSTSFNVTGWSRIRVLIDALSASANATSFDLIPWTYDAQSAQWYEQGTAMISVPDSLLTAQRYRTIFIDLAGTPTRMFLEIRNLLAASRVSLAFIVQGIE